MMMRHGKTLAFLGPGLALLVAAQGASAQGLSQAKLVGLFDTICLKTSVDTAAARQAARRAGLKPNGTGHFSNVDTSLNAHVFDPGKASEAITIDASKLSKSGWEFVRAPLDGRIGRKRNNAACSVTGLGVAPEGLPGLIAGLMTRYGQVSMKARANGRVGQGKGQLAGMRVSLVTRPLKITSDLRLALISVVTTQ